jgi:hypothetical protein
MASTVQKVQGVRALLASFKRRARSTERHYLKLLDSNERAEWPRDAEVLQIEQLVRELAQSVTGSDQVAATVWKPARDFAHEIQRPASERRSAARSNDEGQRLYEESEAEFFRGLQLWADHTSDFLEYLIGYDAASDSAPPRVTSAVPSPVHMSTRNDALEYDIALSYAGEDRRTARELAEAVRDRGLRVFYDEYEVASLWGRDLYAHLSNVYKNKARFCVVLVSSHYRDKLWTRHELKAAQARAFSESSEYILPVRLDDTEIDGILPTTGYVSVKDHSMVAIAALLVAKVAG